jgi:hypothetical protein
MKRNLLTLLIIMFSVFTLWGQDWLSVDENNGFGNTFQRVIYQEGAVFTLSFRWRIDTVPGITVFKYDTLGYFQDSLEIFDKLVYYGAVNGLIGFQIHEESIYIYGTISSVRQSYLSK